MTKLEETQTRWKLATQAKNKNWFRNLVHTRNYQCALSNFCALRNFGFIEPFFGHLRFLDGLFPSNSGVHYLGGQRLEE